jgi:hypothetical protein
MLSSTSHRDLPETLEVLQSNWKMHIAMHLRRADRGNTQLGRPQRAATTQARNPTTSVLTAATCIYALGAGITAAAGTRLALQWILGWRFNPPSFRWPDSKSPASFYLVTTSLGQEWVICAPAAFLGCGSRLSGSLSGIEP